MLLRLSALSLAAFFGTLSAQNVSGHANVNASIANLPLSFEPNAGQLSDPEARWIARGNGLTIALRSAGASISRTGAEPVTVEFLGANPAAPSTPAAILPGKTSYLLGVDPSHWLAGIDNYARIAYRNVYRGIDVTWYGRQGQLEYDFTVRPSADPAQIRMRIGGAQSVSLAAGGRLEVQTAAGSLSLRLPEIYQVTAGVRQPIAGHYRLQSGGVIALDLGAYDHRRFLVIDPVLVYGSFLYGFDPLGMTTDSAGNIYLAGQASAGMPTLKPEQAGAHSGSNCFVMKLNPAATALLYATYVGGSNNCSLNSIAVDSSGQIVAGGGTGASDFPLHNPSWSTFDSVNGQSAVLFKLSAQGNAFVFSTYLSSSYVYAVAFDSSNNAYATGYSFSTGSPTAGAWQTSYGGGFGDAFAAKLSAAGALKYFTFLGGTGFDSGNSIAVDSQGNAYVAGYTDSPTFPETAPGAQTKNAGGQDVFVAKISASGAKAPWLTFFGGSGDETYPSLVRDASSGIIYIAGSTTSADLPTTAGVIQPSANGPEQGFVASIKPNGEAFGFVTYFGGRKVETIATLTEPEAGQLFIAGTASSTNLVTLNALQPGFVGNGTSLFKSTNSGTSWTASDNGVPSGVLALNADPSSGSTILALSVSPLAVYRTSNGGTSWTSSRLGDALWYSLASPQFARSVSSPETVYAYVPYSEGPPPNDYVFRSTDGGSTWTALSNPQTDLGDYMQGLAVNPTNPDVITEVFYSGSVYQSTDGGMTYTTLPSLSYPCTPAWQGAVTGSPDGSIYLGTYSGVCKSTNGGESWSLLSASSVVFGATVIAVSPSSPSTIYAVSYSLICTSTDGGNTWSSGVNTGYGITAMAVAPSNPQIAYAAGSGVVLTTSNGGSSWTAGPNLGFYSGFQGLAVNATHPSSVFVSGVSATDGFAAKLNTSGTSVLWSTFYSGSSGNVPYASTSAGSGDVWLGGYTDSRDLPITANAYTSVGGTYSDGFLARISDSTPACSYALNPASVIVYGSESLTFSVTAPSGCSWTATPSDPSWITISGGSTGTASGIVSASFAANNSASARTGAIDINGQPYSISQAPASCTYSLSSSGILPNTGGQAQISVTAPTGCPWKAIINDPFVHLVSGGSGIGNGTVTVALPANNSVSSVMPSIQVGPQIVTLTEEDVCSYALSNQTLGAQAGSGSIGVTVNEAGCYWSPSSSEYWLSVYGGGYGSGSLNYNVQANTGTTSRTAIVTIDQRQFTITQEAGQ